MVFFYRWKLDNLASLIFAILLRIVGSGFCRMVRGRLRAMLASDARSGKRIKPIAKI